jgi:hypothetical protein
MLSVLLLHMMVNMGDLLQLELFFMQSCIIFSCRSGDVMSLRFYYCIRN